MERYLLFDSGCTTCSGIARLVEQESGGLLIAASLRDPEMQRLIKRANPNWRWEPMILEVDEDHVRAYTGLHMRAEMVRKLGIRRTLHLLHVIATEVSRPVDYGRRSLLKGGALMLTTMFIGTGLPFESKSALAAQEIRSTPGKYAKREGVRSYKSIKRVDEGLVVHFVHRQSARSGLIEIHGLEDNTISIVLMRDEAIDASVTIHKDRPSVDIVGTGGEEVSLTFADRSWHPSKPNGMAIINRNLQDLSLIFAVYADFEVATASTTKMIGPVQDEINPSCQSQPCCGYPLDDYRHSCTGYASTRSRCCQDATNCVNNDCTNGYCLGCCKRLGCDSFCAFGDYSCFCSMEGYSCDQPCYVC